MNSAFRSTLIMMLLAAIASLAAAYYYPWPEIDVSGERINQLLFDVFDKDFDQDELRGIEVVKFNGDRNELQNVQLRRRGDKWILPAKGNFVATNIRQITDLGTSLTDKKIREEMSDTQEDHIKFGVVDPAQHATTIRSSLGTKIILEGRQGKQLGSLIVGKAVKSDSQVPQRFVRIPDQPHVYVIDFDADILSTDLESWIDPNLLQLASANNPTGQTAAMIELDSYRIDPQNIATADREWLYKARFSTKGEQLGFDSLEVPSSDDLWKDLVPSKVQMSQLASWIRVINKLEVSDVRRKSKELISALRKPSADFGEEMNKELNGYGFNKTEFKDGQYAFDSTGGTFSLVSTGGVRLKVFVGNFDTGEAKTASGNLARFLMIDAAVEQSLFPLPENESGDEKDRTYLRAVAKREKSLKTAGQLARELKATYADWFYIVDQSIVENLIPALTIKKDESGQSDPTPEANPDDDAESQEENADDGQK